MPNYSLNFSKGSSTIIAQYYNLIRLGKRGYRDIIRNTIDNSSYLAKKLQESDKFTVINKQGMFPIVAARLKDASFTVFQLSEKLREKGWIVPAYTLPEDAEDVAVMRMVIKENFSRDMVEMLFNDIMDAYNSLELSDTERKERAKDKEKLSLLY